jgi:hypothetical protein
MGCLQIGQICHLCQLMAAPGQPYIAGHCLHPHLWSLWFLLGTPLSHHTGSFNIFDLGLGYNLSVSHRFFSSCEQACLPV